MNLRPYQQEFIDAVHRDFQDGRRRVLGVAATGAGKTIIASELMRREKGNCLFLADAQELVHQNADKFSRYSGEGVGVEMGDSHADPGAERVVVATSHSLFRRLDKYEDDHFNLIIIDEAHRNTLGGMSAAVLDKFGKYARVLGVTATPSRSDRKSLADFYEKISIDIGLKRLIREKFLSNIVIKSIPIPADLSKVGMQGGDYKTSDLGAVIEPLLRKAAEQLIHAASDRRKIVIFLPLVKTSIRMTRILTEMGIRAVHVSGQDKSAMREFTHGDANVICNAQLLSTGWDCPEVDCIMVLRPTKSLALYQQMVGRGTRIADGKDKLLLLDPLYLSDDHRLITPARLVARTDEEAQAMRKHIEEEGGGDLLEIEQDVEELRAAALQARVEQIKTRKARTVGVLEFADAIDRIVEVAEFEPEFGWERNKPSPKQIEILERAGFDTSEIETRGKASKILDLIFMRRKQGLATPKQLRLMQKLGHPDPVRATFEEASDWLDRKFGHSGKQRGDDQVPPTAPSPAGSLPTSLLIRLRQAGLKPKEYSSVAEANAALEVLS